MIKLLTILTLFSFPAFAQTATMTATVVVQSLPHDGLEELPIIDTQGDVADGIINY